MRSILIAALIVAVGVVAQERATLTGNVVDASGAPLPGVTVTLVGPERRSVVTNERGVFTLTGLLPGSYRVELVQSGFQRQVVSLQIKAGENPRQTYTMRPASVNESVAVTGETPAPQTRRLETDAKAGVAAAVPQSHHPFTPAPPPARPYPFPGGESYASIDENPFRSVRKEPLSTFSIDVDTASYANVRRYLNEGTLPPVDAVRVEEMINYFRYQYPQPKGDTPFSVTTELTQCPWNPKHRLALIGLQGRQLPDDDMAPRRLVFLIDVSGSMQSADKLPLIRTALRMFTDTLTSRDRVAIVVYAGSSGLVLPSTPGDHRGRIHRAIAELEAGGSTNGGQGIRLAYQVAREQFVRGGINRVVLATDGDFNVGITSQSALTQLIEAERASGVFLSVLGVGTGNLKDSTMEMLADKGNGNYSYLDSLSEARKVLIKEGGSTLVAIAKDVKLQIEFNPRHVAGYRLIGYENRMLRDEDFNDDAKDAGELGAAHSVTALYEIVPAGIDLPRASVDPLKYQTSTTESTGVNTPRHTDAGINELLTVKLRYKQPEGDTSRLIVHTLDSRAQAMSANVGFASAVAEIGMLLRNSPYVPGADFDGAIARARTFRGEDNDGYRMEFIKLAEVAAAVKRMR